MKFCQAYDLKNNETPISNFIQRSKLNIELEVHTKSHKPPKYNMLESTHIDFENVTTLTSGSSAHLQLKF